MNKDKLRLILQVLLVLSPLPLGCVGGMWLPLCFLAFAIFSLLAFLGLREPYAFLYQRPIRVLVVAFFVLVIFQVVPLPLFLVKWLSPGLARILPELSEKIPSFRTLSLVPGETLMALARFLVYALFFISLLRVAWTRRDIFLVFGTAVAAGAAQTIFGLLKLGAGNAHFFLFFMPDRHLPQFLRGTIYNPDHFAFFLEILFPVALGLLFAHLHVFDPGQSLKDKVLNIATDRRLIPLFLAPVLLAAGIYLTGCRAGIAVLVLSLLFFAQMSIYLRVQFNARRHLRLLFVLATLLAVFIGLQSTLEKFLNKGIWESTGRIDYWANTAKMISDFPLFGTGLGTFPYTYTLYGREAGWVSHAHNEYIESLADMGLPAFAAFYALLALIVFSLLRMWIARRHPEVKPVVLGVLTAVFAAFFHSFFDFSLRIPSNAFLFLALLALGIKLVTYRHGFADENK